MVSDERKKRQSSSTRRENTLIVLPTLVFLFTLDQVATMLSVTVDQLAEQYVYFQGRSTGTTGGRMLAKNINPDPSGSPRWRISQQQFYRWLSRRGFRYRNEGNVIG